MSTWLQRAYPKKVVIDTQKDSQGPSNTPQFAALQDALTSTGQWNELTISSFPPDSLASPLSSPLSSQTAGPMNVLKVLHVAAGCVDSPYFTHLLDLVPTEAPLSELRLYPSFAVIYFLQPHWFPVLKNLAVLIVNGRGIHEPFGLLPAFTQLQIFEADHLPLPWYEPSANIPLLSTLQKLRIRASSVQWMAGREFACLEECAILLPHHWVALQQHGVQLPSCRKLTYHGYPMITVQYLHVPQMKVIELGSDDCKEQRVYQHLRHLCALGGMISNLTGLHLTLHCSEQVFVKVLKYFGPLEELVLSITYPSPSWENFLESLIASPSTRDWPEWERPSEWEIWYQWCSSQTWHANVLPRLKYLGIQCSKGFSQSKCLGNSPLFRVVAWTRAQLSSPLKHLKVWEGRGTTEDMVVDYSSSGYVEKHLGMSSEKYDSMVVRGMVTQSLTIEHFDPPFHRLNLTALFRQLQSLVINSGSDIEVRVLPDLERVKSLEIYYGIIPTYPLNIDLPLVHTLQWLHLYHSTFFWMHGRTFKALGVCTLEHPKDNLEGISGHEELQVYLPACTKLVWKEGPEVPCAILSCPNVQSLQWEQYRPHYLFWGAALKSLHDVLLNSSQLQELNIHFFHYSGLGSLIHLIFCDSWKQGVWKNIRSVAMNIYWDDETGEQSFNQVAGRQQHYEKGWKEFMISRKGVCYVILRALM